MFSQRFLKNEIITVSKLDQKVSLVDVCMYSVYLIEAAWCFLVFLILGPESCGLNSKVYFRASRG